MLAGFEWRAQNPAARSEHRSFYIWSAYSHLQSWLRIKQEYLKARGDPGAEQVFSADVVGKAFRRRVKARRGKYCATERQHHTTCEGRSRKARYFTVSESIARRIASSGS